MNNSWLVINWMPNGQGGYEATTIIDLETGTRLAWNGETGAYEKIEPLGVTK